MGSFIVILKTHYFIMCMLKPIFLICCILALSYAREYKSYREIDCKGNDITQSSSRDVRKLMICLNE